jgi:hypothetical protein|tara:strand:- start:258 stop:401 length:144 start_codon:yes stop_codon:yes gene_type:complete
MGMRDVLFRVLNILKIENSLSITNKSKEMSDIEKSDLDQMRLNNYNF